MNTSKIIIAERTIPTTNAYTNGQKNLNDGIERPYSLIPGQYRDGIRYITYPEVIPNMYCIMSNGTIIDNTIGCERFHYISGGYYAIRLQVVTGGTKPFLLHRLVAYQFCNPPIDFANRIVNHIDGNKHHNYANNLEWVTMAANNQHAIEFHTGGNSYIVNGRPMVNEDFVRHLCIEFEKGKSNTEIMKDLGMEINNANHTLLRDIRGGYTWTNITSQYNFQVSSKKHAYTKEQKETIKEYILQGKTDKEVFSIMVGREYVASIDRLDSSYRTVQSIRDSLKKKGLLN